jgi:hypothetical protein
MTTVVCAPAPQPAAANTTPNRLDRSNDLLDVKHMLISIPLLKTIIDNQTFRFIKRRRVG